MKRSEANAINFLRLGVSEEIVAKGTGLSIEKIRELKKSRILKVKKLKSKQFNFLRIYRFYAGLIAFDLQIC